MSPRVLAACATAAFFAGLVAPARASMLRAVVPPLSPPYFYSTFLTNLTTPDAPLSDAVNGSTWYDSIAQVQRVDHAAGAYECAHFYGTAAACTLFFTPKGLFAVVPAERRCCLDSADIHASPRNWLDGAEFLGMADVRGQGCRAWLKTHTYYDLPRAADDVSIPCKFNFPNNPQMDWYFNMASFRLARPDPAQLALPTEYGDCSAPCAARAARAHAH